MGLRKRNHTEQKQKGLYGGHGGGPNPCRCTDGTGCTEGCCGDDAQAVGPIGFGEKGHVLMRPVVWQRPAAGLGGQQQSARNVEIWAQGQHGCSPRNPQPSPGAATRSKQTKYSNQIGHGAGCRVQRVYLDFASMSERMDVELKCTCIASTRFSKASSSSSMAWDPLVTERTSSNTASSENSVADKPGLLCFTSGFCNQGCIHDGGQEHGGHHHQQPFPVQGFFGPSKIAGTHFDDLPQQKCQPQQSGK